MSKLLLCRHWKPSCPWMSYCRWQVLRLEIQCEDSAPVQRNVAGWVLPSPAWRVPLNQVCDYSLYTSKIRSTALYSPWVFYEWCLSLLLAIQEVSWGMMGIPGCLSPQGGTAALCWLQTSYPTWGLHSALTAPRLSAAHQPSTPPHLPPVLPSLILVQAQCQRYPHLRHLHHMSTMKALSLTHSQWP